jgi:hypothetical protein
MIAPELVAPIRDLDASLGSFLRLLEAVPPDRAEKDRTLAAVRRDLAIALRRAFRAQGRAFLRHMAAAAADFPAAEAFEQLLEAVSRWDGYFDDAATETIEAFTDPLDAAVRASLLAGASKILVNLALGTSFDLANPRAVAYLAGHAAERVRGINDTSRAKLGEIITAGRTEGLAYPKIAAEIRAQFSAWAVPNPVGPLAHIRDRAELIAVNETAAAYESGARQQIDDVVAAGIAIEKSFLTAEDDRVDEDCTANEEAGWIPESDDFPFGDAPVHPGCRCTALYQRAEEAA